MAGMPRIAQVVVPGLPHHITQRGNRRADVFFDDDDRRRYLPWSSAAAHCGHRADPLLSPVQMPWPVPDWSAYLAERRMPMSPRSAARRRPAARAARGRSSSGWNRPCPGA